MIILDPSGPPEATMMFRNPDPSDHPSFYDPHYYDAEECRACEGAGIDVCGFCNGTTVLVCKACGDDCNLCGYCDGEGCHPCAECDGAGERTCGRCDGSGEEDEKDGYYDE
jgi:hypothetical protein